MTKKHSSINDCSIILTFSCIQSLGVRQVFCVWLCQEVSTPSFFWQIFIFAYLVILQVVGIVLAFQTRKVKLRSLKDSKYVAAIIYISSISIVVMALVTFALRNFINIGTGILAFGIFTLTTVSLALIFVPKVGNAYNIIAGNLVGNYTVTVWQSALQPPTTSLKFLLQWRLGANGPI